MSDTSSSAQIEEGEVKSDGEEVEEEYRDKGKEKVFEEEVELNEEQEDTHGYKFPWEKITQEEREALKKRYEVKRRVSDRWKGYVQSLADSATDVSTFLGGAAFVGVTLTFGTINRSILETVVVLEVESPFLYDVNVPLVGCGI